MNENRLNQQWEDNFYDSLHIKKVISLRKPAMINLLKKRNWIGAIYKCIVRDEKLFSEKKYPTGAVIAQEMDEKC